MYDMQKFKSEAVVWVASGTKNLPLDFLPRTGKRGGRLVIDRLYLECAFTLTTPANCTLESEDYATLLKQIRIYDSVGDRRRMTGYEARVKQHLDLRDKAFVDIADFAAGQTGVAITPYVHCFVFTQDPRFTHRPEDYGLPVDDLHRGGIEIQMPNATTDVAWSGAGAPGTVVSGTYTCWAECHEEHDVQFKVRDVVLSFATDNNADLKCPVSGKLVREVVICKPAVLGGTAVTTVTDVTMEPFNMASIPRGFVKQSYLRAGQVLTGQDPVYNDKALPVIHPYPGQKLPDFLLIPNTLLIRLTSTMTTPNLLCHFIAPKDEEQMRATLARFGLKQDHPVKVKTGNKSKEDPNQWGRYKVFMPGKAV